jgi:hypothetical protein
MDLSKLNSNERLAFWGAIAAIVGTILTMFGYTGGAGGLWLTFLLAIAMIVILFLPTWSPQTTLPGSKGTLMLIVGGVSAIGAVLGLLSLLAFLGLLGAYAGFVVIPLLGLLLGTVGGLMMGWGAWQEFQAEGGKFQLGTAPTSASTPPPAPTEARQERPLDSPVETAPPPAEAPRTFDSNESTDPEDRPNP